MSDLTTREAAAFLGISPESLKTDRCTGRLGKIKFYKLGSKLVRYRLADLQDWLAERHAGQPIDRPHIASKEQVIPIAESVREVLDATPVPPLARIIPGALRR